MRKIYLDISPAYLLFSVQCSDADGAAIAPTADALRVYEIDGTSATVGGTAITGSPFDPVQFGAETGLWGAKIAKTSFTAGKQYLFVWAMTVDGVAAQKQEIYAVCNAADFMADVSGLATAASVSALNDFDPATETVTTDEASRIASQAAVSGLATQASVDALPDVAAIRAEMDANSAKLANLDATVTSRLAADTYQAPPSVDDLATAADLTTHEASVLAAMTGLQTTVDGISNVTRLTASLPAYFTLPATGEVAYRVDVALKNNNGDMADPDENELCIEAFNALIADRSGYLYADADGNTALATKNGCPVLIRDNVGLYYCYLRVAADTPEEVIRFKFQWAENSAALYEYRASQIVDAASDLAVIANDVSVVKAKTDNLPADPASQSAIDAALAGVATATQATDIQTAISGLNNFDPEAQPVNIGSVGGTAVTGVADFQADTDSLSADVDLSPVLERLPADTPDRLAHLDVDLSDLSTFDPTAHTVDVDRVAGSSVTITDFHASLTGIATASQADADKTEVLTRLDDMQTAAGADDDKTEIINTLGALGTTVNNIYNTTAILAAGDGNARLNIQVYETGTTQPVADVNIGVYAYGELKASTQTGLDGAQAFAVDEGGPYEIRARKGGYSFEIETVESVTGDTDLIIYGTPLYLLLPETSGDCRLSLFVGGASESDILETVPDAYAQIVELPSLAGGRFRIGERVNATFDEARQEMYWEVVQGCALLIVAPALGLRHRVTVPMAENAGVEDLIEDGAG